MKFTIFSKLVAGYLAIFLLVIIVSIYVAVQLQKLEQATHSILNIDNRMLDHNKKLTDSLLSQVQYEKKFLIMKDTDFYDRFVAAEDDFNQHFGELISIADDPEAKSLLDKV